MFRQHELMNPKGQPLLAREGWAHIAIAVVLALGATALWGALWSAPLWLLVLFVVQFFRDPVRVVPDEPGIAVCPADGKVVFIGPAADFYLDREAVQISIFMDVFSVHANRAPVAGRVTNVWYHSGRFLNAALDKASRENERNAVSMLSAEGHEVVFVQVAGLVARRILCYVAPGDMLERGERYGFIRFGSRLDVFLPADFVPAVKLGDKVKSGCDRLGRFSAGR